MFRMVPHCCQKLLEPLAEGGRLIAEEPVFPPRFYDVMQFVEPETSPGAVRKDVLPPACNGPRLWLANDDEIASRPVDEAIEL